MKTDQSKARMAVVSLRSHVQEACVAAIGTAAVDSTTIHKAFLRICIRNSSAIAPRSPKPSPCLIVHLPPPERSGDKEHQCGDNQADDQGSGDRLAGLAPDDPRCGAGEQEDSGDRAGQQCAEVHAKPEPACLLQAPAGWFSPVVRDQTWGPPD